MVIVFVVMIDSLTCTTPLGDAILKCGSYFSKVRFELNIKPGQLEVLQFLSLNALN